MRRLLYLLCPIMLLALSSVWANHIHSTRAEQSLEELIGGSGRIEVISVLGRAAPAVSLTGYGRLYFDSATNKFRISVNAGAYTDLITSSGNTSLTNPLLIGGTTTTSTLTLRSTSGIGAAGADIIFQTGNNGATEAMRILNNGNIGIGVTSPVARLDLTTTNNTPAFGLRFDGNSNLYRDAANSIKTDGDFVVGGGGGNGLQLLGGTFRANGSILYTTNNSGTITINPGGTGILVLGSAGLERVRIDGSGNVGIGTTSFGTSAAAVLTLGTATAPTTSPASVVQVWGANVFGAGTSGLNIRDEGGNIYKIGSGQILAPNGSSGAVAYGFGSASSTGMSLRAGVNDSALVFSFRGAFKLSLNDNTANVSINRDTALEWASTLNDAASAAGIALYRDADGVLAQRNGVNSQEYRVENTFTSTTNREYGKLGWTSNVFRVGTVKGSVGGTARALALATDDTERWQVGATSGYLLAVTDNTYDIGAVGATRPRSIYIGGLIQWGNVAEPTCNATNRGATVLVQGGVGVADTFRTCTKDAADAYAYRALF